VTTTLWHAVLHALEVAGSMTWQVTWSLILGFTLSAVIEALVRKSTIARLLPDDRPKSLAIATALGAASSSCSYAAVALARSLFRKGANFTSAMAFQFASTNLVIELGLIMALLLGWRFTAAEFVGGPLMILVLALILRRFLSARMVENCPRAGRACRRRVDGRPRRHGHERQSRGQLPAASDEPGRLHLGQPQLRHGMGRSSARPRHRPAHRRRRRSLGP